MKTRRFLAAMMAAALSFNFMACSDDDEPNGGGGSASGDATKRLTKMYIQSAYDGNNTLEIAYDGQGKVSTLTLLWEHDDESWKDTYTYSYNGNNVSIAGRIYEGNVSEGEYTIESTYALNDKGYVTSGSSVSNGHTDEYTFAYTNDYMTLATEISNYGSNVQEQEYKHSITSDGLIQPDGLDGIEYTEIPNKGNFFIQYAFEADIFDGFYFYELYWANLLGKATEYLPEKTWHGRNEQFNYSYKLDDEGYVTSFTITNEEGEQVSTVTCTYEEI